MTAGPVDVATGTTDRPLRLAYLMSRFPKATETFILNEILELERVGHQVEIFPLVRERREVVQPGAAPLVARARDLRPWAPPVIAANVGWLVRRPRAYLGAWLGALRMSLRSPRFVLRAVAVVPAGAAIARAVVDDDLDHIHAHWATHPALAAWVASRLSGRPYTFTGHAHDLYVERAGLDRKIRDAAAVVTISETNRRLLEGWYGSVARDRVTVIHCGVDPAIFAPAAAPAGVAESTEPGTDLATGARIACVASLQPQKGQRFLVDAIGILGERGRPVTAVLLGEGEERPALEAQIRSLPDPARVQLAGAVARDEVARRIRDADVIVQPSVVLASGKTEGIPVALMEAMAAARPVVASELSGIPELVVDGETGLLVRPGDPVAIANAIERLLDDPGLAKRLAAAGRARVLADFDLHVTTAQLVEVFRRAITARGLKGPKAS